MLGFRCKQFPLLLSESVEFLGLGRLVDKRSNQLLQSRVMAESDKGTASSSKAKEKISELDDDISKNFLGSWSTILSSDDSSMDFKFEPVTKGKKKEFDFDKLDMDFSLDGDFDKMKSFKVDMGDLDFSPPKVDTKAKETDFDFSSPPKEGTKFKERSEGESAKSNKGKEDCFAFSFDFNELGNFDLDVVLPSRTKELNKDDGNRGVKIDCVDKHEHHGSKIQLADAVPRDADALKTKSMLVKASTSKENLVASEGIFDLLPETDPSKSSTIQDQMRSKQSRAYSGRENTDRENQVDKRTCNESHEEPQLKNQSAQTMQSQTQSKPALIFSAGEITDHTKGTDKQSNQLAKSHKHSYGKTEVPNQSTWFFTDEISALDVSEQMEATSVANKSGDMDSEMQALNAKVDPPLTLENEKFPLKKMMPHYDTIHSKNLPEAESESTNGEKNLPKSCNVMQGDMDRAAVAKNVPHPEENLADLSKLGAHGAESISGREKASMEVASSNASRFNLKPSMKDKASAATQALPTRLNLPSLGRNALSSLHPSPSGASVSYRNSAQNARSSNLDKRSVSFTEETIVSDNNTKIIRDQSVREHCDAMGAQMKNDLGVLSVPNDGKAAERGTISEKKKEDTKPSSCQMQSSLLPDWSSKSDNQGSENLKPKIPSLQSVRKLKMDTIVGKLSTLKVSKKMPNFSGLRTSSSPALEDKIIAANKRDNNGMHVPTKTIQLIGSGKQRSPAPSMKRKIAEASDAATMMLNPSKRVSPNQSRNSKEDLDGVAQAAVTHQVGPHKNNLDCSLKSDSDKQPESTLKIPHEMKFAEVGVTPVIENDETIEKAEACGKELDQICTVLRKKQEEAKELLVRVLVANNNLLLLSDPMHAQKLCQVQHLASRLISREFPSRIVDPAPQ